MDTYKVDPEVILKSDVQGKNTCTFSIFSTCTCSAFYLNPSYEIPIGLIFGLVSHDNILCNQVNFEGNLMCRALSAIHECCIYVST